MTVEMNTLGHHGQSQYQEKHAYPRIFSLKPDQQHIVMFTGGHHAWWCTATGRSHRTMLSREISCSEISAKLWRRARFVELLQVHFLPAPARWTIVQALCRRSVKLTWRCDIVEAA